MTAIFVHKVTVFNHLTNLCKFYPPMCCPYWILLMSLILERVCFPVVKLFIQSLFLRRMDLLRKVCWKIRRRDSIPLWWWSLGWYGNSATLGSSTMPRRHWTSCCQTFSRRTMSGFRLVQASFQGSAGLQEIANTPTPPPKKMLLGDPRLFICVV